ncbi:permease prefix domain 1-containing protein [Clostridium tagluense]|uniref:permease prefix domain 1-containing protein n=1 Tax=Clostridium tagluense TaxID=360422 RepID=UPI001C0B8688|nr:permease prefix domain 1-containing protein [Clostridium tagluense]MBU3127772.1 hypothetical protein [Clostridium tagluense]MCB2310204.1 permease prefix domain 1-containing protein [Clostridium tagluense]MCB2315154.1 permease prefix domain 1-containing protein [Clostridium tagluense]MCB2319904.1 permease prefix domain 1-containing protein [Clostridium tagluense]MCB2324897.1 permease prefix domain 1-containing protein [Clostridium tagluense]
MRDIKKYVDGLFVKYKMTKETEELREEISSNLEARIKDNMDNGLDYSQAYDEAIKNIDSIDMFIDGNKKIYINGFKKELAQIAVLYILIGWIITIPLRLNFTIIISEIFAVALVGVGYIYLSMSYKNYDGYLTETSVININKIYNLKKYTWIIWWIYIISNTIYNVGIHFASNIWFSRQIHIDGPFQFARLIVSFTLPLFSIVVPLLVSRAYKLLNEYEVN